MFIDGKQTALTGFGDSGGASRFFHNSNDDYEEFEEARWNTATEQALAEADTLRYVSKAGRTERNAGLEGQSGQMLRLRDDLTSEQREYVMRELESAGVAL